MQPLNDELIFKKFKLLNKVVFRKAMGNFRKHRDIKLVTAAGRKYYLVFEPNYHTTKFFTENLLAIIKNRNSSE